MLLEIDIMGKFENEYCDLLAEFSKGKIMVLSSSKNDKVTSRMMSVIQIDGTFYFQTDKSFRKYDQLINNPLVALCIDNIQIEGICKEIGKPTDNTSFCEIYSECFKASYDMYSSLKNERLFKINPTYIERWIYKDGIPFIEIYDFECKEHKLVRYEGV